MRSCRKSNFFLIGHPEYFLAGRFQPGPEVVSIPVEPAGEFETIQSPGYTGTQRRKRSLPQDNTENLAS